ncbi:methyltransferase, UbiE/COQ5 family [Candidatus Vecturithrix granuli]|uniref:Methyltransferase, UbiE/COQ5 family n=1 Tax=Vecturithrix granuli TaxID=1499967 RepID=A0A081BUQ5_VECG1|nr:methyltransferase, UbiE/COQ5 family [Candidatus Vecturithrix granuli]
MIDRKRVAEVYNRPDMVAYYETLANRSGLWREEQCLINRYFSAPARVLIIGCGTGREAFPLEQQGFTTIGIDIALRTLILANEKLRKMPEVKLSFQQGDAVALPYRDESFENVLMVTQVIQHIPKRRYRRQALCEINRILKPGGYGILSAFNAPISLLYLLCMGRQYQRLLREQERGEGICEKKVQIDADLFKHSGKFGLRQLMLRIMNRIAWEIHPVIWKYSDPLPVTWHAGFAVFCMFTNIQRILRKKLSRSPEAIFEPNDFMLDHRGFHFRVFSQVGDLFVHFPDVDEIAEDIAAAHLNLIEYRSLEELQQEQVLSEKERRSKRLLFYVVRKKCVT